MNATDLAAAAAALEASGVRFYRATSRDGGANIARYEPVEWPAAIGRVMQAFGWVIGPEIEDEPEPRTELRLVRANEEIE